MVGTGSSKFIMVIAKFEKTEQGIFKFEDKVSIATIID